MDSEEVGGQICLTFNPTKLPIITDNLPPPSTANFPIGTHNGKSMYGMKCPRNVPQTGTSCGGWLPKGSTAGKCQYATDGPTCECDRTTNCWNCGDEDFTGCIINIDQGLNAATSPTTESPVESPTRTEYIKLMDPKGRHESCPEPLSSPDTRLFTGSTCIDVTIRCLYLDTYDGSSVSTKYIDCKCGSDLKFYCTDADDMLYDNYIGGSGLSLEPSF